VASEMVGSFIGLFSHLTIEDLFEIQFEIQRAGKCISTTLDVQQCSVSAFSNIPQNSLLR
jgi:hypothetical protein